MNTNQYHSKELILNVKLQSFYNYIKIIKFLEKGLFNAEHIGNGVAIHFSNGLVAKAYGEFTYQDKETLEEGLQRFVEINSDERAGLSDKDFKKFFYIGVKKW